MNAIEKYNQRVDAIKSLVCVGLDSDISKIPEKFKQQTEPQFAFNHNIIQQTADYASAYKFNMAFYEARGEDGLRELRLSVDFLRAQYPDILTICDAKRSDLGNTSIAYAYAIFEQLGFDAVTLNPYLGRYALEPFLEYKDKGCIILCRTSNKGSDEFQDMQIDGTALWQVVAEKVAHEWNNNYNCMLVVGANHPEELAQVRAIVGDLTILIPGIGAQGGDIEAVLGAGLNSQHKGLIISSSRGVIFDDNPQSAAKSLRAQINQFRASPA